MDDRESVVEEIVCARCHRPCTDEEKANGKPEICPRCGNGKPPADDGSFPQAHFRWSRAIKGSKEEQL